MTTAPCLDESRALAFVAGQLEPTLRETVEAHVDDCDSCRQVLAALVKSSANPATGPTLAAAGSDVGSAPTAGARPGGRAWANGSDAGSARTVGADSPREGTAWEAGTKIGRYVIRGRLGKGGMGEVYRAEDVELSRPVALKRVLAGGDDADMRMRLVREARAAAQLAHPNVVGVYEVGDANGTPFIAMELVDGVTLTTWLGADKRREPARGSNADARGADANGQAADAERANRAHAARTPEPANRLAPVRTWREIVAMFAQAGRGLAAAHERGLVHRDFKPDNVLVDRSGRARVADFGLARAWDGERAAPQTGANGASGSGSGGSSNDGLARLTATGVVSGTPAYMAPELVDGSAPNAASDQYAFAVALFEALRGQHPFAGKTPTALWANMAEGNIRDGGRAIPAWLDRVVRRGMAVEPALRWPSVGSMVEAIARPPRRMWPWLVGAGAIAVASLVVAIAALMREPPEPKIAEGDWPMPVKMLIQNAVLAGIDGDHVKAIAIAQVALVASPENTWAMQTVATEACKLGDWARGQSLVPRLTPQMQPLIREACTPPPPDAPAAAAAEAPPAESAPNPSSGSDAKTPRTAGAPDATTAVRADTSAAKPGTKSAAGKVAKLSAAEIKQMLKDSGFDSMRADYEHGLELAQAVLASDPQNAWAMQLIVLHACGMHDRLLHDKGDPKQIAYYKQLALSTNPGMEARRRGLIYIECEREGIWLEGDIEEVGTHQKWHAGPTPTRRPEPSAAEQSAKSLLREADAMEAEDPAGALAKVEAVLAADPNNEIARKMATGIACEVTYKLQLHGGTPAEIKAAEAKARDHAAKLTPHARWLVWSSCDRWSGIRLTGDIDKRGDGNIEHIDPK